MRRKDSERNKIQVQEVTDLDIVFGGRAMELLPPYNEIPEEVRCQLQMKIPHYLHLNFPHNRQ
ncbi:hypothetical protein FOI68_23120 [Brevibacillus sp. LEMMJ03]|nr:hypothetical protein FOI68_23120 [Brevibacillus sp. LEMMJ03]